jgi:hypothetical protein
LWLVWINTQGFIGLDCTIKICGNYKIKPQQFPLQ